jgi:hypothetical protein
MISLHRLTYRFAVPAGPLGDAGSPRTAASAKRVKSRRFMGLWRGPARRVGGITRAACIHTCLFLLQLIIFLSKKKEKKRGVLVFIFILYPCWKVVDHPSLAAMMTRA